MTGRELSDKFRELESHIAEKKGGFVLFALFMREDAPDRWDLIVSAPWVGSDKRHAVEYFVDQIKSQLGKQDLTRLSRIVMVDPQDAAVQALNRTVQIEHGRVEVRDSNSSGCPSSKHLSSLPNDLRRRRRHDRPGEPMITPASPVAEPARRSPTVDHAIVARERRLLARGKGCL